MSRLHQCALNIREFAERIVNGTDPKRFNIHKFGQNLDVDTGTIPEDLWQYGGVATLPSSAVSAYLSSSNSADQGLAVGIEGLDANYDLKTVTQATDGTDGQTPILVAGGTWIRIFRAYTILAPGTAGNVYLNAESNHVAGVPQDATKVLAHYIIASQQTQQAIYTIPDGYIGLMNKWWASIVESTNKAAQVVLQKREFGGIWRDVQNVGLNTVGVSAWQYEWLEPEKLPAKTDVKIICRSVKADDTEITGGFDIVCKRI